MKTTYAMLCAMLTMGLVSSATLAQDKAPAKPAETPVKAPEKHEEKKDEKKDHKPAEKPVEKAPEAKQPPTRTIADPAVLGFKLKDIDGKEVDLASFKGKVVLMVNVASKCGYTKQYAGLQKLYDEKKEKGLVILGFPCNQFNGQEPGTESEIKQFCTEKYQVNFPMFAKIDVKGESAHPLYKKLSAQPDPVGGEPKWNFTKFLVDRKGNAIARFDSNVKPDAPELVKKIDELLAQK